MKTIRWSAAFTAILCASPLVATTAFATAVWNGAPLTFTKTASADLTLAANQDRLTNNVWLTRASTQGLFNIKVESFYTHNSSPLDTAWAFGTTANYSSLTYTNWEAWAGNNPPATIGLDAVVHLLTDDVYIDIKFGSWGGSGGAF